MVQMKCIEIHITPNEVFHWELQAETQYRPLTLTAKNRIVICYDVEFPELSRLMADQGMNILFVPFLTDTQNGYTRVKHCARELLKTNVMWLAGCVGNLPKVNNMDIQYAQGCLHPSDFAFPSNGIKAEATQIQK
jgi:hypothetical protein